MCSIFYIKKHFLLFNPLVTRLALYFFFLLMFRFSFQSMSERTQNVRVVSGIFDRPLARIQLA